MSATPFDLLAMLRLEDGTRWGDAATQVQRDDAAAILDPANPERFHFITRSRGYSKTTDLAGVAIAVLLSDAPPGSRSYALAADQDQARLLIDSVEGFVRRTAKLADYLDVTAWKVTARKSRATLEALAADSAGVWGLRPYFAVADELAQWGTTGAPVRIWDGITSAIPKTGGRLAVISTAGSPGHWAKKVRDHAETHPLWRLSETPGPPPWIPSEFLDEQRSRLLPSTYARLFDNVWATAEDSLVSEDDLRACVTLDGPLPPQQGLRYVVAVDLGIKRDASVAVIAHAEPVMRVPEGQVTASTVGARLVLDRIARWRGTRAAPVQLEHVEAWVSEAARAYRANVILDPWQSVGMMQRLQSRGVTCEEFTFSAQSVGRIASVLHRLLRDRLLALPDDEELLAELLNVRLEERAPGVVRLAHDSDGHDDQAVALAMSAAHLLDRPLGPVNTDGAHVGGAVVASPFASQSDPLGNASPLDLVGLDGSVTF
jgi:phage terminase large subunit-like protein